MAIRISDINADPGYKITMDSRMALMTAWVYTISWPEWQEMLLRSVWAQEWCSSLTLTWPEAATQILVLHEAFGGNPGHRHQHIDIGCSGTTDPDLVLSSIPGQDVIVALVGIADCPDQHGPSGGVALESKHDPR